MAAKLAVNPDFPTRQPTTRRRLDLDSRAERVADRQAEQRAAEAVALERDVVHQLPDESLTPRTLAVPTAFGRPRSRIGGRAA